MEVPLKSGHDKAAFKTLSRSFSPDSLTKRELSTGIWEPSSRAWAISILPLRLYLFSLFVLLFKLFLFQLKRYGFLLSHLCSCHSLSGARPFPNSLHSTWQSPTLSTHLFYEVFPNVPDLSGLPHELHGLLTAPSLWHLPHMTGHCYLSLQM